VLAPIVHFFTAFGQQSMLIGIDGLEVVIVWLSGPRHGWGIIWTWARHHHTRWQTLSTTNRAD
jgi:hypothetical protein